MWLPEEKTCTEGGMEEDSEGVGGGNDKGRLGVFSNFLGSSPLASKYSQFEACWLAVAFGTVSGAMYRYTEAH